MSSLALREQLLLASLLAAALTGAAVKHWRDARREVPAAVVSLDSGAQPPPSAPAGPDAP